MNIEIILIFFVVVREGKKWEEKKRKVKQRHPERDAGWFERKERIQLVRFVY